MPVMQISNLKYRYERDQKLVLNNLNLSFYTGRIYGIMGRSGVGKTTLLSIMSGLNDYQEGLVLYQGRDLKNMDRDLFRSRDLGIIFQNYNLIYYLTAEENVMLAMDIAQIDVADKKKHAREMLRKVELGADKWQRKVLKLSGGEQQRVAIARAISYNPAMIVADEPTGNLDGETEKQILAVMKRLAHQEHKCVVIVTHSDKVADNCDEVYRLS